MTSKTSSPNASTSFRAKWDPIPLTMPEPRYRSIPSRVAGGMTRTFSAWNCIPCLRSFTQTPEQSTDSPWLTEGTVPTTVASSRLPGTRTRNTVNPVSSLWKVIRSTAPWIRSGLLIKLTGALYLLL